MKIAIACGGTGGHLFPGVAVAEILKGRGHEVLLVISEKPIDATAVRGRTEFQIEKIPAIGMPRLLSTQILGFGWKFLQGFRACQNLYRSFEPDAVLGMGGFTSTAPILAGKMRKVPTFIHESNAIPGKANKLNARLCTKVLLGFEECRKHFPGAAVEVCGTPIRSDLRRSIDRDDVLKKLRLKRSLKTVLVMGGSQGAHGVNEVVVASLPRFTAAPIQFIHLTGKEDEDYVFERYQKEGIPAFVGAFYHRMEEAYSVADLAIARSGAASLTELAHFGLPAILIPYPHAADNHQFFNAEIFARAGGAELLEQSKADGTTLGSLIDRLLSDPKKLSRMSAQMRGLASDDAALHIAAVLETTNALTHDTAPSAH
jgi:UDP-N-acetylglucosamine--N-acetylmuramyl-(pentapeptide) pyrophosphoryl-undecaprenol N-acetylglucosamine transferase